MASSRGFHWLPPHKYAIISSSRLNSPTPPSHCMRRPRLLIPLIVFALASPAVAEDAPHWAFVPPANPPLPDVKDADWVKSPIDRFILAELEAKGLRPSAAADK